MARFGVLPGEVVPEVDLDDGAITSSISRTAEATLSRSIQWKDWPKLMTRKVAREPGEALGPHLDPVDIGDLFPRCSALGLGQHSGVRVESDDALEEMGEQQSDGAWSATDVRRRPRPSRWRCWVRASARCAAYGMTLAVVLGGALEHGLVPDPVLPPMGRGPSAMCSVSQTFRGHGRRWSVGAVVGAAWRCGAAGRPRLSQTPAIVRSGSMKVVCVCVCVRGQGRKGG